jgi:hypothetical protein
LELELHIMEAESKGDGLRNAKFLRTAQAQTFGDDEVDNLSTAKSVENGVISSIETILYWVYR